MNETSLHRLVLENDKKELRRLILAGACVDARDRSMSSPLHVAASLGRVEVIKALLRLRASVHATDPERRTPLHRAAASTSPAPRLFQALISARANVNATDAEGDTPLHAAVKNGTANKKAIRVLVEAGADANVKNRWGATPLDLARGRRRWDIVCLLRGVRDASPRLFDFSERRVAEAAKRAARPVPGAQERPDSLVALLGSRYFTVTRDIHSS